MSSTNTVDFQSCPIIVLGANHSGTRVLVEILGALGSDFGQCDNEWREAEVFREAHRLLTRSQSTEEWNSRIFKAAHLRLLQPDKEQAAKVVDLLKARVPMEFPQSRDGAWHWKCPTSAFFLDFWKSVYPDAHYVHLHRDPLDVAASLITRRQFYRIRSAVQFCEEVDRSIRSANLSHYLRIPYASLAESLPQLVQFAPGLDASAIPTATRLVRKSALTWRSHRSLKHNVWVYATRVRVALARRLAHR